MTIPLSLDSMTSWRDSPADMKTTEPHFRNILSPFSERLLAFALPLSTMTTLAPLIAATVYWSVSAGS